MYNLKAPHKFSGGGPQGHDRVRPLVIAFPDAAKVVGRSAACGDKDQVFARIHRESGPRVASAGARLSFFRPGDWIPAPAQLAGACVEGTDDAAAGVNLPVIGNGRDGEGV